ncbi:hypothetical protein [Streptomyces sp. V3I7]|uniref:hypothetical protein n=1 Tax=Streptomyces sp. V3I7 TaxID=3042278 RepID=UPI002783065A|nr:hypothetical protein [Streptomyces sp. V3I7]MDQ0993082.1 hypothetical protein [Streptomyces sp. V3I7]
MTRPPRAAAAALLVLAAAVLTAGCDGDRAPAATPSATSSATPSGYEEMRQKVADAESAVGRAEKDATDDGDR